MFNLVYEFKLKPTRAQATLFEEWLEQCRRVYNYALQERKDWVNSRKCLMNACSIRHEYIIRTDAKAPTYKSQCEKLTQAKKHIQALKQVQSQVLQQTLKRLHQAFEGMGRGFLGKHCLDAGWGQFLEILQGCCFKRGIYFQKVNAKGTSFTCPKCLEETGKKKLSERLHKCQFCGYTCDRDTAAAQVVKLRGLEAVGHTA